MRSLPLQCETIRIVSVTGERRRIRVSGLAKARWLWLFRNFYILDFPVLNKKQQQMIAQAWNAGSSAGSKEVVAKDAGSEDAPPDLSSLELIGTVEGYLPQLYPAPVAAEAAPVPAKHFRVGEAITGVGAPITALAPRPIRVRIVLPGGLRVAALWTAVGVLLLGGGLITLGPKALGPSAPASKPQSMPPSRVAAVAPANPAAVPADPVRATPPAPVSIFAKAAPPALANSPAPAAVAPSFPPLLLPDAMASSESSPDLTPPHPRLALRTKAAASPLATPPANPPANREVTIRVSVDSEGHAQAFQIIEGNRKNISAALHAARRFAFQPCASSGDCDHLLKFTDYGDASIVQRID